VSAIDRVADDVVSIRFTDPNGRALPRWTPGAHIDIDCGEGISRQYSLCGDPSDRSTLQIAVLRDPDSRGGSRWIHETLCVGDSVRIRGPRNHFKLDLAAERYVLVAGGIGITPVLAMADHLASLGKEFVVHYAGRSCASMAFLGRLARDHGDRLHVHPGDAGVRMNLAALFADPAPGTQIYACGPERLLDGLAEATAHWPDDALHVEHFSSSLAALDPSVEHAFEVVLKDSGITVPVPADRTVLQALRAANIDAPADCEEGICGACEVPVVDGEIDHRDLVLTKTERAAGKKMMTCFSRACGSALTIQL
jgi:ferredoxin-NADP reductase